MNDLYRGNPSIRFESGEHPASYEESEHRIKQTQEGDEGIHVWNDEVKKRISSYAPAAIAIDSLEPTGIYQDDQVSFEDKALVWTALPGRPSELNGTDEITVIAGDNLLYSPEMNGVISSQIRLLNIVLGVGIAAKVGSTIGRRLPVSQANSLVYDWDEDRRLKYEKELTMSRRSFIAGAAGATIAFSAYNITRLSAFAPWRSVHQTAIDAETAVQSVSIDTMLNIDHTFDYLQGRTSLLMSKMRDYLATESPRVFQRGGSVVMGSSHGYEANKLLDDPKLRADYIRNHAKLILDKSKSDKELFKDWTDEERQKWIEDFHSTMQVFRVFEPDAKRFKRNPKAEIERVIKYEGMVTSPSVASATRGIS